MGDDGLKIIYQLRSDPYLNETYKCQHSIELGTLTLLVLRFLVGKDYDERVSSSIVGSSEMAPRIARVFFPHYSII
jgi:hypothetical protein